ncbi:MAG: transposase domain-containing protein [Paracoccaceae bacterium]
MSTIVGGHYQHTLRYLKATLEAIAKGHPAARIDELMPWNFKQNV